MPHADPMPQDMSRSSRRKQRTRFALMDAAQSLVRERGAEGVTIQDITDRADVGLGTFYNYFESKSELFGAILDNLNAQFFAEVDELQAGIKDPAMAFAITLRYGMECILNNTPWAWFLVHSGLSAGELLERNSARFYQEIQRANDAGRFKVDDPRFALMMVRGLSSGLTQGGEVFGFPIDEQVISRALHYVLRMLGLPDSDARSVAYTPLPSRLQQWA